MKHRHTHTCIMYTCKYCSFIITKSCGWPRNVYVSRWSLVEEIRYYWYTLITALLFPEYDSEEVVTYEEVELLYPSTTSLSRPIVLVGPLGVGKTALQRRLVQSDVNQYQIPTQRRWIWCLDQSFVILIVLLLIN